MIPEYSPQGLDSTAWEVCTGTSSLAQTWTEAKHQKLCSFWNSVLCVRLQLSWSGHFHVHTTARIHRKQGEVTIPLTIHSEQWIYFAGHVLAIPRKDRRRIPFRSLGKWLHSVSTSVLPCLFHLHYSAFDHESWLFSTVVRVLSRERERERKRTQENDLAELSLWVALWWVDLILTAFDNLNYLWFLRGYEHLRGKKKCYDSCRTFCNIYKLQRP